MSQRNSDINAKIVSPPHRVVLDGLWAEVELRGSVYGSTDPIHQSLGRILDAIEAEGGMDPNVRRSLSRRVAPTPSGPAADPLGGAA